jgi:hypothetical protein
MVEENVALDRLLCECRKFYKGCKRWAIYESYKRKLDALNLAPEQYETALREIVGIVNV